MPRRLRVTTFATLSVLWCGVSASAETMRCQSINGNLNCAGSGGVSCQTVNGRKVCVSGHGDVVQSFGAGSSSSTADGGLDDDDLDSPPPGPASRHHSGHRTHSNTTPDLDWPPINGD